MGWQCFFEQWNTFFFFLTSGFTISVFSFFSFCFCFCFRFFMFLFDSDWLLTFARITVSFAFFRNCKKEKNKQKKFSFCFVYLLHFRWRFFSRVRETFFGFVCLLEKFFHNFSFLTCCALLPATLSSRERIQTYCSMALKSVMQNHRKTLET